MRTVHLCRRPLGETNVATNVLKHGTGALNINVSRVTTAAWDAEAMARCNTPGSHRLKAVTSPIGTFTRASSSGTLDTTKGRWPANVILQHRVGCREAGTRSLHVQRGRPGRGAGGQHGRYSPIGAASGHDFRDPNGMETVAAWNCAPGCPVADLDRQAGPLQSGTGAVKRKTAAEREGNTGVALGAESRPAGTPMVSYGDAGGASRFFKQVVGGGVIPADLIEYLTAMIAPTHLADCKVLFVEHPETYNWAEHEDATVHGLIVVSNSKASPIAEAEMWRVLKPGGHVMLIAPEDQPTGHTGACALENAGFEIRDAILWVQEPGRYHYVPKPPSKERHAGCENLKFQRKLSEILGDEEEMAPEDLVAAIAEAEDAADTVSDLTLAKGNIHPTCKPRDMMIRLLQDVPKDVGPVLDPFMGSGTTVLACLETGHNALGIEKESEYLEIADTRVRFWDRKKIGEGAIIESEHKPKELPKVVQSLDDFFDL